MAKHYLMKMITNTSLAKATSNKNLIPGNMKKAKPQSNETTIELTNEIKEQINNKYLSALEGRNFMKYTMCSKKRKYPNSMPVTF